MERIITNGRQMALNFCYDDLGMFGIGYPNLAQLDLDPDQFDHTWPRSIPLRLSMYLQMVAQSPKNYIVDMAPHGAWYPVALGYHDYNCDYFSLMPLMVHQRLKKHEIKVMFYYHEGDNPYRIKENLDLLCRRNDLPLNCYIFISANSAAERIQNFFYFSDHEHFFRYINRRQDFAWATSNTKQYDFTALNRTHKWWRAACMADLHRTNVLSNSIWSYNSHCSIQESELDNPIEIDSISGLRHAVVDFVNNGPYFWDGTNDHEHNDHRRINADLYTNAYCSIVLETHFDADQSGGSFLTEKTYKPIKFGQPFVLVAPQGSLDILRRQGYRTFDHVIDNSYDRIENNTERWLAVRKLIIDISCQDLYAWYLQCLPDVIHNQNLFQKRLDQDISALLEKIQ